jgi:hypothetical protein
MTHYTPVIKRITQPTVLWISRVWWPRREANHLRRAPWFRMRVAVPSFLQMPPVVYTGMSLR